MQAMCKVVAKSCEDVKQSIRRARQKALDTIKKASSGVSKDHAKKLEKEIDDLTKKFIKSLRICAKRKRKRLLLGDKDTPVKLRISLRSKKELQPVEDLALGDVCL
ncbi:hypothetical protein MLD38_001050 [Melastoma candidum]|uniref:Uncharacterized protein n=1 Tax=Melastoma candidum TaxID=119954 RepID=A0ACB9SFB8_9MYRT|nr:hypothetical protein MLD38_001050 [Melastoma candidum]